MNTALHTDEDIERLAQRRASAKLGWYTHAIVYVLVNAFLLYLSMKQDRVWAIYPALGWGFGLLMHGVGVFVAMPGGGLHESLVQRERAKLQAKR